MTGLLCGAVNGFFVAVMGLPALLVTLGTLALFRGLCYVLLGGTPISPLPEFFTVLGNDNIPGLVVPWAIVPFLVLAVVFGIVLHRSTVGRRIYAIGGNPETARYSGIRVARIRFVLFVVSGVVSGLAGMIYMGITSQVAPDGAQGLELDVITVVFLAGVSVLGGKGRITGVVLASILILALRKSLQLMNVSGYTQGIAVGGVLIASLLVTNLSQRFFGAVRERRRPASQLGPTPRDRRFTPHTSTAGCHDPWPPCSTPERTPHESIGPHPGGWSDGNADALADLLCFRRRRIRRRGANNAAGKCVEGPIKIGLIPKLGTDPYMVTVQKAVEAAAAKDGSTVIYTSPSDATGAAQIPFVNQLISQGVDVIAISGSDLNSASAALAKAKQAGIKVISWDSDVAPGLPRVLPEPGRHQQDR